MGVLHCFKFSNTHTLERWRLISFSLPSNNTIVSIPIWMSPRGWRALSFFLSSRLGDDRGLNQTINNGWALYTLPVSKMREKHIFLLILPDTKEWHQLEVGMFGWEMMGLEGVMVVAVDICKSKELLQMTCRVGDFWFRQCIW